MGQGLLGFEYLTALFRKCYGLDRLQEDSPEYLKTWNKAAQDFSKSFKDYLTLFGVVPREEHLALVRKYEELKVKLAGQEETINHLRMLLSQKMLDQGEVTKEFQTLAQEQAVQFQELMKSFEKAFKVGKGSKATKTTAQ